MSLQALVSIVALLTGALSLFSVAYLAGGRLARLEGKVDTMWAFAVRRGISEAVKEGLGTMSSPIVFNAKALALIDPLKGELTKCYENNKKMTEFELMLEIERQFGQKLLEQVCVPSGLTHGACLILALAVVRGEATVDLNSAAR